MVHILEGKRSGRNLRVGIVVSRFNSTITDRLLQGALETLERAGCGDDQIEVARVPGAFEIAPAARQMAASGRVDAIVCLGCVIRGQTPHFDYICGETARGVGQVACQFSLGVGFGVLTCDTIDQALDRAGRKMGNKGSEAAEVALEMTDLLKQLRGKT